MRKSVICLLVLLMASIPSHAYGSENSKSTEVVISYDGMRQDFLEAYMKKGIMPNFKKIEDKGMYANNIQTIFPSLTSASHAAIATGTKPSESGMVSNEIHKPDKKLTNRDSAFFSPLDSEPVWSVARKKGKTTATILFPGSNPTFNYQADYAIYYGETWAESDLAKLDFHKTESKKSNQKASITLKMSKNDTRTIYIVAFKSTKGQKGNYDTFHVSLDPKMKDAQTVKLNKWGSLSFLTKTNELAGFSFKIKANKPDLSDAKMYRTAVTSAIIEGPGDFKNDINRKFGYFPVQDDDEALDNNWITRKEYEEISTRFAQWTTDVSLYIKDRYKPDILFFYYPQVDHESHNYLLVDPRQPGYSKEKSERYMNYIRWSYRLSDEMLGQVLSKLNKHDRIYLVSDHGMEPVHSRLSPNEELEKEGLLVKDGDGEIDYKKSKAFAVASGSIAQVYINLKGREKEGIVEQRDYDSLQKRIADIFENAKVEKKKIKLGNYLSFVSAQLSDNDTTIKEDFSKSVKAIKNTVLFSPVKQLVSPYEKVIKIRNSHENTGDVLLVAQKGYYMAQGDGNKVMTVNDLGNHGGDPARKELIPIFMAAGKGITQGEIESEITTLDIAPTLYKFMQIDIPDFIDGKPIPELTEN
ncbi:alkaline phosphatase family protein [Neobacillus sp. YIM B06451]|uniref:alkaline phosphatase family protein n=1 Tax=Neobacillus sp. YIM B06451 TaxID=3070994 RepID=UPI00292DA78C|nr:alkaline phosphatase family protein [Neobacillus sp. YIM B06451]